jgi:hypothetical protein
MQPSISDEKFRSLFKDMPDDEELIESAWPQKPKAIFLVLVNQLTPNLHRIIQLTIAPSRGTSSCRASSTSLKRS